MNAVILLSGCVNPNNMAFTKLSDPDIRRQQYISGIRYYLTKSNLKIIFIENSGNDLSSSFLREIDDNRLEILTFNGNGYNRELGKGYGEMEILKHAMTYSRFFKDSDFVFKVTGRIKLLNLTKYLKQYASNQDVDVFVDLRQQLTVADSRFFGATPSFYKNNLIKFSEKINDSKGWFFEHALCYACLEIIQNRGRLLIFRTYPLFQGVSGTDNTKYNTSFIKNTLMRILYTIRWICLKYT